MKRIRNSLLTLALVLVIVLGGMTTSSLMLKKVEAQAVRTETEDAQEEIILTEEETDHLALVLRALEEDNLTKKGVGSGASIPAEKAKNMMQLALEEMGGLMLSDWLPDMEYMMFQAEQGADCVLLADANNLSLEMYEIESLFYQASDLCFEIKGILDAQSGLLISLDLSFMDQEEVKERIHDKVTGVYGSDETASYNMAADAVKEIYGEKKFNAEEIGYYSSEELSKVYPLITFAACALMYYFSNTNFEFSLGDVSGKEESYQIYSQDKEYYLEIKKEDLNFHFQLHKFDL